MTTPARILIIAGSDSGGGAGIQADIKTVTALGGYAMTAVTALTAQNTLGVHAVDAISPAFVAQQITSVLDDLGADCIKTGMLHDPAVIDLLVRMIDEKAPGIDLVVDPVMVAQSGDRLVSDAALAHLRDVLIPKATVITPNLPEAEALLGTPIPDAEAMPEAAAKLLGLGCQAVLLKGGHLSGDEMLLDILATADGQTRFHHPRIQTTSDHGTGCTLASAIAEGIGRGLTIVQAVTRARAYLQTALATATPMGHGHGPVNHAHTVQAFDADVESA